MWLDTDRRLLDARQRVHRERVVAVPPDVGRRQHLRGPQGRPLLRAVRHRAVEPRARPARRVPRRHRASVYVRFPVVDRDFDLLVWTTTPWTLVSNVGAAVGPDIEYVRVRTRDGGRDLVLGGGAGRRRARRRRRGRRPGRGVRPRRPPLRAPVRLPRRCRRVDGCAGRRRRLRHHRRRLRHRAPRARVRRDRPRGRRRRGPADAQPGRAGGDASTDRGPAPWPGSSSRTPTPRIIDDARGGRAGSCGSADYTHSYPHCWRCGTPLIYWAKPTWFARTSAHKADAAARERDDRLAPRAHQARPLRRLAREQRRLGALPRPLLGHPAPGVALRRLRPRHLRRLGRRARRARRAATSTDLDLHRPFVDDVTHRLPEVRRPGARRVEPVLDAWFDSGVDAGRAVPLPVRERRAVRAPLPRRLHLRGDRPDPRLVLLAARGQHARVRPRRRTATSCASRCSSTRTARRCRRAGATSSTRGRCSTPAAPTRCAGTSSPPAHRGRRSGCRSRASTRPPTASSSRSGTPTRFFVTYANLDGWTPDRGPDAAAPTHVLDRWVRSRLHAHGRATVDRRARGLRRAARRAGARALRRRPLQLVRAPLPAPLLERPTTRAAARGRSTSACPTHAPAARAVHARSSPTRSTAGPRRQPTESVHLADWPAVDAAAIDPALEAEMARRARGRVARPRRRAPRRKLQGAPTAARARWCCCPAATTLLRRGRGRDRRRAQREAARDGHRPRGPARRTRCSRTSAPSARRSASACRR